MQKKRSESECNWREEIDVIEGFIHEWEVIEVCFNVQVLRIWIKLVRYSWSGMLQEGSEWEESCWYEWLEFIL